MNLFSTLGESSTANSTLHRLVILRWWLLTAELVAILVAPLLLGIRLPIMPMLGIIALQAIVNGISAKLRKNDSRLTDIELFSQILVDLVALSILLFLSGGASNPLISLLLPPVAMAALALPLRAVVVLAIVAITAYSLLMVVYLPLPIPDPERAARLHLSGMWATFVFSIILVTWLVFRMTASIRQRDAALAAAREQALRDERVIALGALAAGTAHELSTPLATMTVIAGELELDKGVTESVKADLQVLRQQVLSCKEIISKLTHQAGVDRVESAQALPADHWLSILYQYWVQSRPSARGELRVTGTGSSPSIVVEKTLEQGLINLLDNGIKAGHKVDLVVSWDSRWLILEICDDGPGFPVSILRNEGTQPITYGRSNGVGIGLFLARAAIERQGGKFELMNREGGVARIRLPHGKDHE